MLRKFSEIINFSEIPIIAKKVNQIRKNVVCVVARLVFVFCCALTTGRCNAFQHIFVNQKKSEFYGPYFQTMLFLVTMIKSRKLHYVYLVSLAEQSLKETSAIG